MLSFKFRAVFGPAGPQPAIVVSHLSLDDRTFNPLFFVSNKVKYCSIIGGVNSVKVDLPLHYVCYEFIEPLGHGVLDNIPSWYQKTSAVTNKLITIALPEDLNLSSHFFRRVYIRISTSRVHDDSLVAIEMGAGEVTFLLFVKDG